MHTTMLFILIRAEHWTNTTNFKTKNTTHDWTKYNKAHLVCLDPLSYGLTLSRIRFLV